MLEGKTLIQLFILFFGVPAFIYAWFTHFADMITWVDFTKGIILTAIGAFTGLVIGCRQLVKLISEWHDLRKKIKPDKENEQKTA